MLNPDSGYFYTSKKEDHPQQDILKRHIERAVQDLFLTALKEKSDQLIHIFSTKAQIDGFIQRMLEYWEELENYETCIEINELSKKFRRRWAYHNKKKPQQELDDVEKIKNLFR